MTIHRTVEPGKKPPMSFFGGSYNELREAGTSACFNISDIACKSAKVASACCLNVFMGASGTGSDLVGNWYSTAMYLNGRTTASMR